MCPPDVPACPHASEFRGGTIGCPHANAPPLPAYGNLQAMLCLRSHASYCKSTPLGPCEINPHKNGA